MSPRSCALLLTPHRKLPAVGSVSKVIVTLNTVGQLTYPHNEQLAERLDSADLGSL
jgi:hypothetical protein